MAEPYRMRILFDTNVLLDALLDREPYVRDAAELVAAVETGTMSGLLGATTVTTIYYIAERALDRERALQGIRRLLMLFEVAPVNRAVLEDALRLDFQDFEDAVLHEAARHAAAEGIVTRNVRDFSQAVLPVYTPAELLQIIQQR